LGHGFCGFDGSFLFLHGIRAFRVQKNFYSIHKDASMTFLRDFGLPELLIILVIIVLLFGAGRIGKVAGELGKGIRSFRDSISGKKDEQKDDDQQPESLKVEK